MSDTPTFDNPIDIIDSQDKYSGREVGLTHPDVPGFVRIRDNGDIEIVAGEGLAILMHPSNGTITFVADHINFMTRGQGGLRWNHILFNDRATTFNEPTFVARDDTEQDIYSPYEGVDIFLKDMEDGNQVAWVRDEQGNKMTLEEYTQLMKDQSEDVEPDAEDIMPKDFFEHPPPGYFAE